MTLCFFSPAAEQDVDEIVTYIANENPQAAHSFLDALFEAINNLSDHPDMGHVRDDLTDRNVRFLSFKWHYIIIYRTTSTVEIVRVLSGYRDIANLLG